MKIGVYKFKRRYTAAQVIVDIMSAAAVVMQVFIIIWHIQQAADLDRMNHTDVVLHLEWYPLLIWLILSVAVFGVSIFLIVRKKKQPQKYTVTKNNVVKYCNIIDTCISCVRFMILVMLADISATHSFLIFGIFEFPTISVLSLLIIAGIFILTRFRLEAISEVEKENGEETENKRSIVED